MSNIVTVGMPDKEPIMQALPTLGDLYGEFVSRSGIIIGANPVLDSIRTIVFHVGASQAVYLIQTILRSPLSHDEKTDLLNQITDQINNVILEHKSAGNEKPN